MKNFFTVFKESTGEWSMRRFLAFILDLSGIGTGSLSVAKGLDRWSIAVAFGVPIGFGVVLLLFTTWEDIRNIVSAVKGK